MRRKTLDILRAEIESGKVSRYRISKDTGIDQAALWRLINDHDIYTASADILLHYFGYEVAKKPRAKK